MFDYMVTPCMGDRQNLAQASASAHPASAGLADAPSAGTVHAEAAPAKALDEADWWLLKTIYIPISDLCLYIYILHEPVCVCVCTYVFI